VENRKEYIWLASHPEEYSKHLGETIAVVKNKIVAHGKDAREVIKKAKELDTDPLITKVPSHEIVIV